MASPTSTTAYTNIKEGYAEATDAYLTFYSLIGNEGSAINMKDRGSNQSFMLQKRLQARFYAFVTDFGEAFNSSWDSTQYYGKTDPIVGFKHITRTISLSWSTPATTVEEALQNIKNINNLILMTYPAYISYHNPSYKELDSKAILLLRENSATLSKPPYVKVEWTNLIRARDPFVEAKGFALGSEEQELLGSKALTGWFDGLTIDAAIEEGFFSHHGDLLVKTWNLSCTFNVLHQHQLGRNEPLW